MEGGRGRLVFVGLVLGLLLGQSEAFNPICYAGCVGECLVFHGSLMTCAIKCIWKCLFALSDSLPADYQPDSKSLCQFSCAAKFCANITTPDYIGTSLSLQISLYMYIFLSPPRSLNICISLSFSDVLLVFCLVRAQERRKQEVV